MPLPLPDGDAQGLIDPGRKGEGIVDAGVEGLPAEGDDGSFVTAGLLKDGVGKGLDLWQIFLNVCFGLLHVPHICKVRLNTPKDRIPDL